ncbi:MAG: hypothetical protein CL843_17965 [Crocinitomicaceae bacterium]|nr:hypothetical protein [Crocinitomicaceae bacterium]|tara:strand:+ start:5696 stop:6154 length:459 start_codon:yes stop_codon:yes gene_type:complete
MEDQFKMMQTHKKVHLTEYLPHLLLEHPECEIHVGCDSQNFNKKTTYATTVVVRYPGKGAHVLYRREKQPQVKDLWSRLWGEIERSLSVAQFIEADCGLKVHQIDLDFNEDPEYPSNKVLKAAVGYVHSMGFNSKAKPHLLMATWAANSLCH